MFSVVFLVVLCFLWFSWLCSVFCGFLGCLALSFGCVDWWCVLSSVRLPVHKVTDSQVELSIGYNTTNKRLFVDVHRAR